MPSIPGYCPHCGCIFDGRGGIHIENSVGLVASGNRMTCPNCGKMANLVDGTFNTHGSKLEMVSGSPLTRAILEELQLIAERVQNQEITPDEAIAEASNLSPALGALMERFITLGLPVIAVLISLLAYNLQRSDSDASSDFYADALAVLHQQTELLKQQHQSGVGNKSRTPPKTQTHKKSVTVKRPSHRRKDVNAARRKEHIERRKAFPRHHR